MNRRDLFIIGLASASCLVPGTARAQTLSPIEPIQPGSLAERLSNPTNLSRVFVDTAFVQLWRAELAPRGYENSGDWYASAVSNRSRVSEAIGGDVVGAIMRSEQAVAAFQEQVLSVVGDLGGGFAEFLNSIGIAPDGPAGQRLVLSLRDFALLSAAALPEAERQEAEKSSFMWPFC